MKKMKNTKVVVMAGEYEGINWLFDKYAEVDNVTMNMSHETTEKKIRECDLVVWGGGPDVTPEYYGEKPHTKTQSEPKWDEWRFKNGDYAVTLGKPMVGICGGAQFGCVLAGGSLNQHMENHCLGMNGRHQASMQVGSTPLKFFVSSDHHQTMEPHVKNSVTGRTSVDYVSIARDKNDYTQEIVWFKGIKFLAAQYHPEWMNKDCDGVKIFLACVAEHCFGINDMVSSAVEDILSYRGGGDSKNQLPDTTKTKQYTGPATLIGDGNNEWF